MWRLVDSDACQLRLIKSRLLTCIDLAVGRCFSFKLMTHHWTVCWDWELFASSYMGKITFLFRHFNIMLFLLYYQQRMSLEKQPYLRRKLRLRFWLRKTHVNVTLPTLYSTSRVRTCQEEPRVLISEPTPLLKREQSVWAELESVILLAFLINSWLDFPDGSDSKSVCLQCGRPRFNPWVGKIPLEKEMASHPSTLAWKIPWTYRGAWWATVG